MTQSPYSPMGNRPPLAGEAEIAAMHAKLANKLKPSSSPSLTSKEAAQSPQAKGRVPLLDHELWLAKRLKDHGAGIFTGDTTPEIRMARFRKAIKDNGLQCVIVGRNKDGAPETYPELFARLYGEPL